MKHIAINFHYVGMRSMPHEAIHSLTETDFEAHLEALGRSYSFTSLSELAGAVANQSAMTNEIEGCHCLITFDDGLRCQYESALPILDDMGISAAFFILTGPLLHSRAATVHKLQFSRASIGDARMIELVTNLCEEKGVPVVPADLKLSDVRESYRYDDEPGARLKYFLNYRMPENFVEDVMARAFSEIGITEMDYIREFYMTAAMVTDLVRRGMVGSHGVSHRPLARLTASEVVEELLESKQFLESSGNVIRAVSYPLGNKEAVNRNVAEKAKTAGYLFGYPMERAKNTSLQDPLLFGRFDSADIRKTWDEDVLPTRSRYVSESVAAAK